MSEEYLEATSLLQILCLDITTYDIWQIMREWICLFIVFVPKFYLFACLFVAIVFFCCCDCLCVRISKEDEWLDVVYDNAAKNEK